MLDMPYFMENKDWYEFDAVAGKYVLTDEAPERARKSYEEYMLALDHALNEG